MKYFRNGVFIRELSPPVRPTTPNKGAVAWGWLHEKATVGDLTEEIIDSEFVPLIPRFGCGCLDEWRRLLKSNHFRKNDQEAWAIEIHNEVNKKLGKPLWPYKSG